MHSWNSNFKYIFKSLNMFKSLNRFNRSRQASKLASHVISTYTSKDTGSTISPLNRASFQLQNTIYLHSVKFTTTKNMFCYSRRSSRLLQCRTVLTSKRATSVDEYQCAETSLLGMIDWYPWDFHALNVRLHFAKPTVAQRK